MMRRYARAVARVMPERYADDMAAHMQSSARCALRYVARYGALQRL